MADRYWVGGSGTWNTSNTKWSATSGGASGASVPTTADDVFFDANSSISGDLVVTFTTTSVNAASISIAKPSGGNISWTGGSTANTITIANNLIVTASSSEFTTNSNISLNFTGSGKNVFIQSNGANFATHNITLNGANGNFTLNSIFASNTFTFANGNLLLNGYDLYCNIANITTGSPKVWSWGSNSIYIAGSNATVLTYSAPANTVYTGTPDFVLTYDGGVGNRTMTFSASSVQSTIEVARVRFTGNATDEIRFSAAPTLQDFNLSNFVGVMNANVVMNIYGNLTLNPSVTYTSGTGLVLALRGNSSWTPTQTINGADTTLLANLVANGTSNYSFAGNLTLLSNRTANLATGNLVLNGYTLTTGLFNSNNSGVRGINASVANSEIKVTSPTGSVIDVNTTTNLTITGNNLMLTHDCPTSVTGNVANYYFGSAGISEGVAPSLRIISGNGNSNIINATLKNLDLTGFTGTLNGGSRVLYGNLTITDNITFIVGGATTTFIGNNDSNIYTGLFGYPLDGNVTINKTNTSATVRLTGNLGIVRDGVNRVLNVNAGTLDTNGYLLVAGSLVSNGTNTRRIVFSNNQRVELTANSGNIIDFRTATNLTLSGNSNILIFSNTTGTINIFTGNTWTESNAPNITIDNMNALSANYSNQAIASGIFGNINLSNYAGNFSFQSSSQIIYYGGLWETPNRSNLTIANGGANFTFSGSAEQTIITNGKVFPAVTMIIDKSGGNLILGDNVSVRSTLVGNAGHTQLNNGNIVINGWVLNTRSFTSNTSTARTIDWGNQGIIDIWSNTSNAIGNVTVWSTEGTNLIANGSRNVAIKANAGSGNTLIVTTSPNVTQDNVINFIANTPTITDQAILRFGNTSNTDVFGNINITRSGQSGYDKIRHANILLYGNLVVNSTDYRPDSSSTLTFVGNNEQTLTARPVGLSEFKYVVNKSGGNVTHSGQFITNGYGQFEIWGGNWIAQSSLSINKFAIFGNTGSANLTLDAGITVQSSPASVRGNMYFANTSNITIFGSNTPGSPFLTLNGNCDLYTGDKQIPYIGAFGDSSNSSTAIYGNLTCGRATLYGGIASGVVHTYKFESGKTYSFDNLLIDKYSGDGLIIESTTPGVQHYLVYNGTGNVNVTNTTISDSNASPANTWYAPTSNNNVDGGNNFGWIFAGGPIPITNFYQMLAMFR